MKSFRLWGMVVLILSISMLALAPREASAEKHLGITEKQFMVRCNKQLSEYSPNLRFIKDEVQLKKLNELSNIKWTSSYRFYNRLASLDLAQESSGLLTRINFIANSGQKTPDDPPIIKPGYVLYSVAHAVLSDLDYKKFVKQFEDKFNHGLEDFVITVGGNSFDISNSPLGMVLLTITPAQ